MFNKKEKKDYKRLNEHTVMCIHSYYNNGDKFHNITLYYEDTNEEINLGEVNLSKNNNSKTIDNYEFNNSYVVIWQYNTDSNSIALNQVFDVNKRCSLLGNDNFNNYFNYLNISSRIELNPLKKLKLGKQYKK